jgi:hypothetical protein
LEDPAYGSRSAAIIYQPSVISEVNRLVATNNIGVTSLQSNAKHSASAIVSQLSGSTTAVAETDVTNASAAQIVNPSISLGYDK